MKQQFSNNDRFAALESRVSALEQRYNKNLEIYRRIQIGDEAAISHLQDQLRTLHQLVESLLKDPPP